MPETTPEHRHAASPYAALHAGPERESGKDAAKVRGDAPGGRAGSASDAAAAANDPDYLTMEAGKLENLKLALYAAFEAAPTVGIPTALVDLAATYTSALRLQMTLRGISTMPARSAKAPVFAMPRTK